MPEPISDETMAALSEALLTGRKIEAIKLHREFSGLGLKESKEAVEKLEASLREKFPEKFANSKQGKGCVGLVALLCLVALLLTLVLT